MAILNFLIIVLSYQIFGQNTLTKKILWTTDWSPNGKYIAIGGNIDTLNIYSEGNLQSCKSFPVKNTITRIKWHPTLNIIAVTTQLSNENSFILNLETNEKIELNDISPNGARGLDWNYTGEYLGVADNDGQILIYDIKGKLIRKFVNQVNSTKGITALDWHPKKNMLTTVADKIRILDTRATRVVVRLALAPRTIHIEVHDNGRGFDSARPRTGGGPGGRGLVGMRERVELLGGTLRIDTSPDIGTHVIVDLPQVTLSEDGDDTAVVVA